MLCNYMTTRDSDGLFYKCMAILGVAYFIFMSGVMYMRHQEEMEKMRHAPAPITTTVPN